MAVVISSNINYVSHVMDNVLLGIRILSNIHLYVIDIHVHKDVVSHFY